MCLLCSLLKLHLMSFLNYQGDFLITKSPSQFLSQLTLCFSTCCWYGTFPLLPDTAQISYHFDCSVFHLCYCCLCPLKFRYPSISYFFIVSLKNIIHFHYFDYYSVRMTLKSWLTTYYLFWKLNLNFQVTYQCLKHKIYQIRSKIHHFLLASL